MEEGRLFYHYLDGEQVRCELEDGEPDDGPRFRLSIVGEDERIELRDLSLADLEALRDQLDAAIRQHGGHRAPGAQPPDGTSTPGATAPSSLAAPSA
jgi:hypothetical protein